MRHGSSFHVNRALISNEMAIIYSRDRHSKPLGIRWGELFLSSKHDINNTLVFFLRTIFTVDLEARRQLPRENETSVGVAVLLELEKPNWAVSTRRE